MGLSIGGALLGGIGGGAAGGSSKVSDALKNIDPTTSTGLTNIGLGGVIPGLTGKPAEWADKIGYKLSGQEQQDQIEEAADEAAVRLVGGGRIYRNESSTPRS